MAQLISFATPRSMGTPSYRYPTLCPLSFDLRGHVRAPSFAGSGESDGVFGCRNVIILHPRSVWSVWFEFGAWVNPLLLFGVDVGVAASLRLAPLVLATCPSDGRGSGEYWAGPISVADPWWGVSRDSPPRVIEVNRLLGGSSCGDTNRLGVPSCGGNLGLGGPSCGGTARGSRRGEVSPGSTSF